MRGIDPYTVDIDEMCKSRHKMLISTWLAVEKASGELVEILEVHSCPGRWAHNMYTVRFLEWGEESSRSILALGELSPLEALGECAESQTVLRADEQ